MGREQSGVRVKSGRRFRRRVSLPPTIPQAPTPQREAEYARGYEIGLREGERGDVPNPSGDGRWGLSFWWRTGYSDGWHAGVAASS